MNAIPDKSAFIRDAADLSKVALTPEGLPKYVALTGEKGHGKDTVAKAIMAYHDVVVIRFADGLKEMLRAFYRVCGLDEAEIERKIEGDLKEVPCGWLGGKTPRYAMQTLGTEWREMIWREMWAHQTSMRIKASPKPTATPDLRFPDPEEDYVDDVGALKIRVVNPRLARNESSSHSSEQLMAGIRPHFTLVNDGTIEDLNQKVRTLLTAFASGQVAQAEAYIAGAL